MNEKRFYVYVHSRVETGLPFYVGKGMGRRAYSKRGRNMFWKKIVGKDGGFVPSFLVDGVDEEFAMLVEVECIAIFRRRGHQLCNVTDGGEGVSGLRHSEETRAKLSRAGKGKPAWNKGVKATDDAKRKMSAAQKRRTPQMGRPCSDETRAKMSATRKGRAAWNKGLRISEETRQRISAGTKGITPWNKGIPQRQELKQLQSDRMRGNTLRRGKKASAETKRKQSASQLARYAKIMEISS